MAECIVKVGMEATFDPFLDHSHSNGVAAMLSQKVTGTVVYVNETNHWFSVLYGNGQRISFQFNDHGRRSSAVGCDLHEMLQAK